MSFGVKAGTENAELVRAYLASVNLIDASKKVHKSEDFIIFPVTDLISSTEEARIRELGGEITEFEFPSRERQASNLKEYLRERLTSEELESAVTSFDLIGDIAVIEVPEELLERERVIAEAVMSVHKNVNVVCKKVSGRVGEFRVQGVKVILGENRTETTHLEHGCKFKVDLSKAYFSTRLSNERKIIAEQVREGEVVGALFAGVGPYPIVIAKTQPLMEKAFAVELNPEAVAFLKENIELNKASGKVSVIEGDAKEACLNELRGKCDRVIMPLPHTANEFLEPAIQALKPAKGVLHFYWFEREEDLFTESVKLVKEASQALNRKVKILDARRVGMHSPRLYRVCVDAEISI